MSKTPLVLIPGAGCAARLRGSFVQGGLLALEAPETVNRALRASLKAPAVPAREVAV